MKVFKETQRFDQWWLRAILAIVVLFLLYSMYSEYITALETRTELSLALMFSNLFGILIIFFLLFFLKLETRIDEQGIHYAFWPFQRTLKKFPWSSIKKCYVRDYSPIGEYGGWGYRAGFKGTSGAMNVKGTTGIQLEFKNGKKLLVGTQKENEAKSVIATYAHKITS
ncbi:hypothetical protein [Cochleicola gelatinilyticus]|uniref:Bacterial Pleckstrin homology domain-containing protein n=1 Tax=Cochleicola gelatinilyticus TaxID=1763537 RepID=A0A167KA99_9FLAO|nr:hypothetical protein [Cochleicola gelatinilyticus]OAB81556.1 hypothetical protein ULVI_01680 [Cochleicola gelatinilyticus]